MTIRASAPLARVGHRRAISLVTLVGTVFLAGCQIVGPSASKSIVGYNPLYDQGDELRELVNKGDLSAAKVVYAQNKNFFTAGTSKHEALLADFAGKINDRYATKLKTAADSLLYSDDEASWSRQRAAIASAESLLAEYGGFVIVREAPYRSAEAAALDTRLKVVREDYQTHAASALARDTDLTARNFFDAYPPIAGSNGVFAAALPTLAARLRTTASAEVLSFARLYRADITGDTKAVIGRIFLECWLREQSGRLDPAKLAVVLDNLQSVGITSRQDGSSPLGVVLVTDARRSGADFAVAIDQNLPIQVTKLPIDEVSNKRLGGFECAIVVMVNKATANRKIVGQSRRSSTFIAGYRREHNPDYDVAELEAIQAQSTLESIRRQNIPDPSTQYTALQSLSAGLATTLHIVAEQKAENNLQRAMARFRATPATIEKEIRQPYEYMATEVVDTRAAEIDILLVERGGAKAQKFSHSLDQTKRFTLLYGIHDKDPARDRLVASVQSEAALTAWENADLKLSMREVLGKLSDEPAAEVALASLLRMPAAATAASGTNDLAHRGNTRNQDRRFSSVVVIRNPNGALGAGFFVRDDIIMTNRHVIEGAGFAKIITFDGREATGKVIAENIVPDLALLRVPLQGQPVEFPKNGEIEPGTQVEAIGHPKDYTFSITRGIVSGLRMISEPGGKKVAYVQTDAPISPGNSGGPLFRGNQVVGISTWTRIDEGSQNLNFAIDYREALTFIRDSL